MLTKDTILSRIISSVSGKEMGIDEQILLSKLVLDIISFCRCSCRSDGYVYHICRKFELHDVKHSLSCKCCQTSHFTYFLGKLLEQPKIKHKLPEFYDNKLNSDKIAYRIYDIEREGSRLLFKIDRHYHARDPSRLHFVTQHWQFDFENMRLKPLNTEDDDNANYEFFRKYILRDEEEK